MSSLVKKEDTTAKVSSTSVASPLRGTSPTTAGLMNFGPRRQQQESDSFAQLQSLTKGPKVQSPKKLPLRRQAVRLFKSFDERGGEVDKETRMLPDQISEEDSQLCDDQKELQPLNSNSCNAKDDKLIENVKKQLRFVAKDRNRRTMRNDNFNKEIYGVPKTLYNYQGNWNIVPTKCDSTEQGLTAQRIL